MKKAKIIGFLDRAGATVTGFAPIDRFTEAKDAHHPSALCKNARSVIVFATEVPRGVFQSPRYSLHFTHRSYHTMYPFLDEVALSLCRKIESDGFLAVPVPSYAPMVYQGMEPWGILSLKHAAVAAGLGVMSRCELVLHPEYGSRLRFGAVVTDADFQPDAVLAEKICPDTCRACVDACPSGALKDDGFEKMTCLFHTVRHGIYPLALKEEQGMKNIEVIINTAGYNYWLKCNECLKACPRNR